MRFITAKFVYQKSSINLGHTSLSATTKATVTGTSLRAIVCGIATLMLIALGAPLHAIAADEPDTNASRSGLSNDSPSRSPFFNTALIKEPERTRGVVWPPLASLLLPGFDQWWENQHHPALAFSGFAFGGLKLTIDAQRRLLDRPELETSLSSRDDDVRTALLGSQMYAAAGSMSAYFSFRSAVHTQQPLGRFRFLDKEESVDELLAAPFEFSHLKRPTTYVPLALLTGLMAAFATSDGDVFHGSSYRFSDAFFAGSFSYLAGTNEEALFRGWMMPLYMDAWESPFWSNTTQALIFALGHLGPDNRLPLPQFVLGWYLGHLTQKNQWTLSESIFIHTWWDVLAFTGEYLHDARAGTKTAVLRLPTIIIPF